MGTPSKSGAASSTRHSRLLLGWVLAGLGLLGHLLAARAIGGTFVAFRDHIAGFIILTVVSAAIFAGLGRRFWRGRTDITVLLIGATQAVLGVLVYLERFRVHG